MPSSTRSAVPDRPARNRVEARTSGGTTGQGGDGYASPANVAPKPVPSDSTSQSDGYASLAHGAGARMHFTAPIGGSKCLGCTTGSFIGLFIGHFGAGARTHFTASIGGSKCLGCTTGKIGRASCRERV